MLDSFSTDAMINPVVENNNPESGMLKNGGNCIAINLIQNDITMPVMTPMTIR